MSDIKNLKSLDLESITIMGTSINFVWGLLIGIVFILFLIGMTGIFNVSLLIMMLAIAFAALIFSIPHFFGVSFLYNILIHKLRDVQVKIINMEEVTSISIIPTALIVAIISLIIAVLLYPIIFIGINLMLPILYSLAMQGLEFPLLIVIMIINPITLLYAFIFPFIFTAIGLFVFNNITKYVGGVKVSLTVVGDKTTLNSVTPLSAGIISGIICLVFGLIYGLLISIVSGSLPDNLVLIVSLVLGGLIGGFIYGAFCSILYNFFAKKFNPIKLELENAE